MSVEFTAVSADVGGVKRAARRASRPTPGSGFPRWSDFSKPDRHARRTLRYENGTHRNSLTGGRGGARGVAQQSGERRSSYGRRYGRYRSGARGGGPRHRGARRGPSGNRAHAAISPVSAPV